MTRAQFQHRPTRRSLLLSGAVLAPLGLTGCDPEGPEGLEEEPPPPPVTVTVEELVASPTVVSEERVVHETWAVRATGKRPLSMLVAHEGRARHEVQACLPTSADVIEVDLDEATTTTTVDGTGEAARLYASVPDGSRFRTTMHTSEDLRKWSAVPLGDAVHTSALVAGDGLLVGRVENTLHVWDIALDGTASPLAPVTIPDDQLWSVRGLARRGELIVVLLYLSVAGAPAVPHTFRSADGGETWSAPVAVSDEDGDRDVKSVHVHGDAFVLVGDLEHAPDWAEGETYWRPAAWSSADGETFVREEIPLPEWGLEGWSWRGEGVVDAGTPTDFLSWTIGGAELDAEGTSLHVCVYYRYDPRTVTRGLDGSWSSSPRWAGVGDVIQGAVSSPDGAVFRLPQELVSATQGQEHGFDRWLRTKLLTLAPPRGFAGVRGQVSPLLGVMRWNIVSLPGEDDDDRELPRENHAVTVGLGRTSLDSAVELPEGAVDWVRMGAHALDAERTLLTGAEEDEDGVPHFRAMVLADGEWVVTEGLEGTNVQTSSAVRQVSTIDGALHFPLTVWEDREDGTRWMIPSVFTSEDGLSWSELGRADPAVYEGPHQALGVQLNEVVDVDGTLIGIGAVLGEDDYFRAATVIIEQSSWTVHTLEQELTGSHLTNVRRRDGQVEVEFWWDTSLVHGVLGADGSVNTEGWEWIPGEEGRSTLDLGDGALLAVEVSRQTEDGASAVGTCLWASRDGGESWTQTMLPGLEGRELDAEVLAHGEDAVVITADETKPYGYRILAAKQQILDAGEQQRE